MDLVTHFFSLLDIHDYSLHAGGFRKPYKEMRSQHLSTAGVVWQGRSGKLRGRKGN